MPGGNPGGMPGGAYPGGNPPGGNPGGGGGGIVRPALPAKTPAVAPAPGAAAATDRRCAPSRGHATYLSPAGGSASWGPCACRRADADASPSAPPAVRKRAPWYGLNHAKPMPEPLKVFVPRTFGEVTKAGGNTARGERDGGAERSVHRANVVAGADCVPPAGAMHAPGPVLHSCGAQARSPPVRHEGSAEAREA